MRLPHALVGALSVGFALANLVRTSVVPVLGAAGSSSGSRSPHPTRGSVWR